MRLPGRSFVEGVGTLLRSPRAVIASLAGNSVVWQAVPDLIAGGIGRLVDAVWGAFPFAVTAVVVAADDAAKVGAVFEWTLFGYLVYRLLPRLLPDEEPAASVFDARRFRLLTTGLVVALAQPVAAPLPVVAAESVRVVELDTGWEFVVVLGAWAAVSWTLLYAYLSRGWWRAASLDERFDFVQQVAGRVMTPEERAEERDAYERDDWVHTVSDRLLVVGASGKVVVLCAMLGFLAAVANMLFPVVEVLVLVGAVADRLAEGRLPTPTGGRLSRVADRASAVETRLYTLTGHVTTSRKGLPVVMAIVTGLLLSAILVLLSLVGIVLGAYVFAAVAASPSKVAARPVAVWNALGFLVCVVVPGLYSFWFWLRTTARVPHFLADWEQRAPGPPAVVTVEDRPPLVTRPPYALLPPTLCLAPVAVAMAFPAETGPLAAGSYLYAVGWPLAVAVAAWSVRWTFRADPQPPASDGWALFAAFLVQFGWLVALGLQFEALEFDLWMVVAVPMVSLIYYQPEIRELLRARVGVPDRYVVLAFAALAGMLLLAFGAVLPVFTPAVPQSTLRILAVTGAALLVVAAVGGALVRLRHVA